MCLYSKSNYVSDYVEKALPNAVAETLSVGCGGIFFQNGLCGWREGGSSGGANRTGMLSCCWLPTCTRREKMIIINVHL